MASGFNHLQYLPVVLAGLALIAFFTAYGLAVQENDVNAIWPYISDAGGKPPQSCIFGQFLNLAAVFALISMYIHYKHIKEFNITDMPLILHLNNWSLWIGIFTCLGLSMVANFQVYNSLPAHMVGAMMVFGLGMVYCWIQAVISYKMRSLGMSSTLSAYTRFLLSFLVSIFFVITLVSGFIASAQYSKGKNNSNVSRYNQRWKEGDPGYNAHLASTFSEWLMSGCFLIYFLTFFKEFQNITVGVRVQPKAAEIFTSRDHTGDEARIVV